MFLHRSPCYGAAEIIDVLLLLLLFLFLLPRINRTTPLFSVAPPVGISADQQPQQQYGADAVQPTSTYTRSEQTLNDDDGRTQRHTVEEQQTKTYSSGDGGSLSRTTTTSRRQMVSYSHTGDLHQQPQRKRLACINETPLKCRL